MYGSMFGGSEQAAQLKAFDQETRVQQQAFINSGLGESVVEQYLERRQFEYKLKQLTLEQMRDRRAESISTAIIFALIIALVLESLYGPKIDGRAVVAEVSPVIGRLVTVRYALMAMWIAVILARPAVLHTVSITFGCLLIAFTFIFGLLPLGKHD